MLYWTAVTMVGRAKARTKKNLEDIIVEGSLRDTIL
jgi:hypothetical protein